MAASPALRILVIEDDSLQQMLLRSLVESAGYQVLTADNGAQALTHFQSEQPDVVLLDYELPDISGRQLIKKLREIQRDWLPILFLSAHTSVDVQRECLLSGGDDYIIKPYDFTILEAKIQSLARLATLQRQIREQAAQLQRHIQAEEAEAEAAHYLYSRLTSAEELPIPGCKHWLQPASKFSGDIICTATGSNGHHYVLLADATGHGLSAAIGLIPVTQVFYSMSRKGHQISRIVREMNHQIRRFTPIYRFVAAIAVEIDPLGRSIDVWNGGMPTALTYQQTHCRLHTFPSRHVALGLSNDADFHPDVDSAPYQLGDPLLLFSDGICDAESPTGDRLGTHTIEQVLLSERQHLQLDCVQRLLQQHLAGNNAHDDVAVVLCHLPGEITEAEQSNGAALQLPAECAMTLTLHDRLIGEFELIPTVVDWCRRAGVGEKAIARLHTILMELVNNAVDHGILLLDSGIKAESNGFFRYLEERATRLQALQQATLDVHIALQNDPTGAAAVITVTDSGPGFDMNAVSQSPNAGTQSGRGLQLLRNLTESLDYLGNGNRVRAVLRL